MKNVSVLFAICALFILVQGFTVSCTDTAEAINTEQTIGSKAHIKLICATAADITPSAMRASLAANGKPLTDLFIFDYDRLTGTLLQVLHQTSEAADFAEPDLTLDYGEHTLKVIATRSASPTLLTAGGTAWTAAANVLANITTDEAPAAVTSDKTSDTFGACADISVTVGTAPTANITLERIAAKLVLNSTDDFPEACSTIETLLSEYTAFSFNDFDVIGPVENQRSVDVSGLAGTHGTTITYFLLAPECGYTTDITITTNCTTGKPYSCITVKDVPIERNKITTITGSFYNHQQGFAVSLNDAWSSETNDIRI